MRTEHTAFLLGALLYFAAYGLHPWLWHNAHYELVTLAPVFYLMGIAVMFNRLSLDRKTIRKTPYIICEYLAFLFAFCQTLQYFDEVNRNHRVLQYGEIMLPIILAGMLGQSIYKRLKRIR